VLGVDLPDRAVRREEDHARPRPVLLFELLLDPYDELRELGLLPLVAGEDQQRFSILLATARGSLFGADLDNHDGPIRPALRIDWRRQPFPTLTTVLDVWRD